MNAGYLSRLGVADFLRSRVGFLVLACFIISVGAAISFENFLTVGNLKSVFLGVSTTSIVAAGMMILLISGVFDVSVGAVFGFAGAVAAFLMFYQDWSWITSVPIAMLASMLIGLVNGVLVAVIGVNPLIATLAMLGLIRGAIRFLAGSGIIDLPDGFLLISGIKVGGIPMPILYMAVIILVLSFLVQRTVFFQRYFYIGANEEAARLSGIDVSRMRVISFILASSLAGLAGIIYTSRLTMAMETVGVGLEMSVLTACFIGGASLTGGKGTIAGAFMGTVFVALVSNVMVLSKIDSYWINVAIYLILLLVLTLDVVLNRILQNTMARK